MSPWKMFVPPRTWSMTYTKGQSAKRILQIFLYPPNPSTLSLIPWGCQWDKSFLRSLSQPQFLHCAWSFHTQPWKWGFPKDKFFQPSSRVEVEVTVTDSCSDLRKYYSSKSMSMLTLLTFLLLLLSISGVLYLPYQYFVNYYCQIRYIILYHDKTTCSNTWYTCISPRLHLYFCPLLIFVIVLAFVFDNPLT